jgi:hypothetical protein
MFHFESKDHKHTEQGVCEKQYSVYFQETKNQPKFEVNKQYRPSNKSKERVIVLYTNHAVDVSCRKGNSQPETQVIEKSFAIAIHKSLYNSSIQLCDVNTKEMTKNEFIC